MLNFFLVCHAQFPKRCKSDQHCWRDSKGKKEQLGDHEDREEENNEFDDRERE